MKIVPNTRSGGDENPNEPPKAGASVSADQPVMVFSGGDENPNEPPKAGASVNAD